MDRKDEVAAALGQIVDDTEHLPQPVQAARVPETVPALPPAPTTTPTHVYVRETTHTYTNTAPQQKPTSIVGVFSLYFACAAIVFPWVPGVHLLSLWLAVIATGLAMIAMAVEWNSRRGPAVAGLIVGVIAVGISLWTHSWVVRLWPFTNTAPVATAPRPSVETQISREEVPVVTEIPRRERPTPQPGDLFPDVPAQEFTPSLPLVPRQTELMPSAEDLRKPPVDPEVREVDVFGMTPLHRAARDGDLAAVKSLLARGADPNLHSKRQWTPLHLAAWHGHAEIVEVLLNNGADLTLKGDYEQTALQMAEKYNRHEVVALLKKWVEKGQ